MDIDSTVQAANIAYPADAHLMMKTVLLVHKVWTSMKQNYARVLYHQKWPRTLL